ncbi:MAG: tRNA lysidine(34) synthetase TilS [Solirubrobacterales bacterium]
MLDKVQAFIVRHHMIKAGDRVLAAVSGGPDSVSMLHVLLELARKEGFSVCAAHLNHKLRLQADQEAEFVADFCARRGVELLAAEANVAELAQSQGISIEMAGREARYRFLRQAAEELNAQKIATAHHLDDQAETVLMRLIQGASVQGMQGIAPVRGNLIRPLLGVKRYEIERYLAGEALTYCIDFSNYDQNYLRNRIRHELLPLLHESYNPAITDALGRFAETVRVENQEWQLRVADALDRLNRVETLSDVSVDAAALAGMDRALRGRVLFELLHQCGARRPGQADLTRLSDLLSRNETGRMVPVSGGLKAGLDYGRLRVYKGKPAEPAAFCYPVEVPGTVLVPEIGLRFDFRLLEAGSPGTAGTIRINWEALKSPLVIRSREPGDRFQPLGMQGHTKKLKDYLIDEKIPAAVRTKTALLASGNEIYWIVGLRLDERVRVRDGLKTILEIGLQPLA